MNALNTSGWKPEMGSADVSFSPTHSGDRALMLEEALSFELGRFDATGSISRRQNWNHWLRWGRICGPLRRNCLA